MINETAYVKERDDHSRLGMGTCPSLQATSLVEASDSNSTCFLVSCDAPRNHPWSSGLLGNSLVMGDEDPLHLNLFWHVLIREKSNDPAGCSLAHPEILVEDPVYRSMVEIGCSGNVLNFWFALFSLLGLNSPNVLRSADMSFGVGISLRRDGWPNLIEFFYAQVLHDRGATVDLH